MKLSNAQKRALELMPLELHSYRSSHNKKKYVFCYISINKREIVQERTVKSLLKKGLATSYSLIVDKVS